MNLFQGNIILFPSYVYSPINGVGGGGGVHLSYSSNSGAAKICQRGQSEGARGGCGRGVSHGREIFQNLCMKGFSCTLETIIRGSLCTGVDQFPTLLLCSFCS